jgi:formylmethanofuran dehydrogenase subunit E-like metal-binding protein
MKYALLGLVLAAAITAPAKADSYDAHGAMDGLTTIVVSSKGVTKVAPVPSWIKKELARQTAANKKAKTAKAAKVKSSKIEKVAKVTKKTQIVTVAALEPSDLLPPTKIAMHVADNGGYIARTYHSQYYMPYSGHVSKPEPETDYREDFGDFVAYR